MVHDGIDFYPLLVGPIYRVQVDWQSLPEFLAIFTSGPQLSALRTVVQVIKHGWEIPELHGHL